MRQFKLNFILFLKITANKTLNMAKFVKKMTGNRT